MAVKSEKQLIEPKQEKQLSENGGKPCLCAQCSEKKAEWEWPCLKIRHSETTEHNFQADTTRWTFCESVLSHCKAGLCKKCDKKVVDSYLSDRPALTICSGILVFSSIGFIVALIQGGTTETVIFGAIAAIMLLTITTGSALWKHFILKDSADKKWRHLCWVPADSTKNKDHDRFVPLGDGLYKNMKHFSKMNHQLYAGVKETIYNELIETGKWKEMFRDMDGGSLFCHEPMIGTIPDSERS